MIKNLIFDIGNVLADFCWKEVLDSCGFSEETSDFLAGKIFQGPFWVEYDRGVMGDAKVTELIRKSCAGKEKEFDILYSHFPELVRERPFALPLFKELHKKGYGVYILSNYGDTMFHSNAVSFSFLKEADGAVFSYLEKTVKPDAKIYQLILERYCLKAEECLFVDDTLPNIEAARKAGIEAEQVTSEAEIRTALKKYGVETCC